MNDKCMKCHPQCKACKGPSERDCITCLNVRMQQGSTWECLEECPKLHYFDGNTCLPCNTACRDFGFAFSIINFFI